MTVPQEHFFKFSMWNCDVRGRNTWSGLFFEGMQLNFALPLFLVLVSQLNVVWKIEIALCPLVMTLDAQSLEKSGESINNTSDIYS